MFHQLLTPVANSLVLSCLVAMLPVLIVLLLLGILRRPAWQAALGTSGHPEPITHGAGPHRAPGIEGHPPAT